MQALILKDFYVMWKQTRVFLLVILVFSAIPGSFNAVFAVIYSAMLPYTAMAYDERSKWNQLAAMMPYSDRDIVLSKYAFGWLFILAATVASLVLQAALSLVWPAAGQRFPCRPAAGAVRQRVRAGADTAVDVPLRYGAWSPRDVPHHLPGVRQRRRCGRHCPLSWRAAAPSSSPSPPPWPLWF